MHIEILQSPWLCELMAFHINLRETKTKKRDAPDFFDGCSLEFNDGKPSLSFELLDSVKIDIDLTCPICLVCILFSSLCTLHIITLLLPYSSISWLVIFIITVDFSYSYYSFSQIGTLLVYVSCFGLSLILVELF